MTINKAVAATAIGACLRLLKRKGQNPDYWEAEYLVRALAWLACGQNRQVFYCISMALIPPCERAPAAVERIEITAAKHARPSVTTLQMILKETSETIEEPNSPPKATPRNIFGPITLSATHH